MVKKLILLLLIVCLFDLTATKDQLHAETEKFNMTYVSYGSTASFIQNVDMTKGSLQVISPNYFELNVDGSLHLSDGIDTEFIKAMHDRNIKVVPFLGNEWNRDLGRTALKNRGLLSDQIAEAVKKYHLDGVNVDIENLTKVDRDNYTDLVKNLRTKLPLGSEVSVSISADPEGTDTAGVYDNKAMSVYVDYFMLMTYDEHYPGDPDSGPVASLPFVEKSIQQALKQIPEDKLVVGIPFYGRLWNGDPTFNGQGISNRLAEKLITQFHGTTTYDETTQSVNGVFTIGPNDTTAILNSKPLPPGNYTMWYENDRSIKEKLKLVQKYHLKGTGSWSLEQGTTDTWNYYNLWLNGIHFADVEGHWAQSDILRAALNKWMTGIEDTRFAPDQPLTRAQAAVVLIRMLGLDGSTDLLGAPFADVPTDHWAWKEITIASNKGYIQGTTDSNFAPEEPLTREQFCQMMVRILSLPQAAQSTHPAFSDLSPGMWSYTAITSMRENNLIDGFEDNSFRPQSPFTRAQMAVILNKIKP
jgi:spore germination protein YaaH